MSKNEIAKLKINKENIKNIKPLLQYIKPHKQYFFLGMVFVILSSFSTSLFPYLLGKMIDVVSKNNHSQDNAINHSFTNLQIDGIGKSFEWSLGNIIVLMFIQLTLQFVFSYMRIVLLSTAGEKTIGDIKKAIFKKLIYMPMPFFIHRRVGELNSRLSTDLTVIQEVITSSFAELIRGFFTIFIAIAFILWISPKLALVMVICIAFVLALSLLFITKIRKNSKEIQQETANSNVVVQEALQGIVLVKTFLNELFEFKRFSNFTENAVSNAIKNAKYRGVFVSTMIFGVLGAITIVLWYGSVLNYSGELSTGKLTMFIIFSVFIGTSFFSFAEIYAKFQKSLGASEEVRNILCTANEENSLNLPYDNHYLFTEHVKVKGLDFCYPNSNNRILNDVHFNINKSEKVYLIGKTGSGKSTISSLLLRLYPAPKNTIFFDDVPIEQIEMAKIRDRIAIVSQDVFLFGGTIRENILYGNEHVDKEKFNRILDLTMCNEFIKKLPKQLDTIVGERGIKLSGGQKQRISIARALFKNFDLLILDEATSSIDVKTEKMIMDNILQLLKNKTILIITHRTSSIKHDAKKIFLENHSTIDIT